MGRRSHDDRGAHDHRGPDDDAAPATTARAHHDQRTNADAHIHWGLVHRHVDLDLGQQQLDRLDDRQRQVGERHWRSGRDRHAHGADVGRKHLV